jgi:hypothetical protein
VSGLLLSLIALLAVYLGIGWLHVIVFANDPLRRAMLDAVSPWLRAKALVWLTVGWLPFHIGIALERRGWR